MALKITKKSDVKEVEDFSQLSTNNISDFAPEIVAIGEMQDAIIAIDEAIAKKFKAELEQRAELVKSANQRLKKLRGQLDELYESSPAEETFIENAGTHAVEIGKKGTQRKIKDMPKVYELMGKVQFFKLAKMDLKDIDSYLTPPERDEVLSSEPTARNITITPIVRVKL